MSHIASEKYYSSIKDDIARSSGAILYIEGVQSGTKENHDILDRTLGMKLWSGTYDHIAEMIGMRAQGSGLYMDVPQTLQRYPDISVDELISFIGTGSMIAREPIDVEKTLSLEGITPIWKWMIRESMRALMNISLKTDASSDILMEVFPPKLKIAILDKRNEYLVNAYLRESPPEAIFLYGALHFEGVYELLKKSDPSWKIISIQSLYPYVR
jgi:pheromone shutdown protein TraB